MSDVEALAEAAVRMALAHIQHQPSRQDKSLYACKGWSDPITGHFCQFHGTAQEQHQHLLDRVAAALRAALPDDREGEAP